MSVPAGPFWMGCSSSDSSCADEEKPGREVSLSAYSIERTEVTVGQYSAYVADGRCGAPDAGGDSHNWGRSGREPHPVNGVSWNDAAAYCAWLGRRLPTEAEWEKAARGTDGRVYPWGNAATSCARAVMGSGKRIGCGKGTTAPVGSKRSGASPYGALGMAGNVWEWTAGWYDKGAYGSEPRPNPDWPLGGSARAAPPEARCLGATPTPDLGSRNAR